MKIFLQQHWRRLVATGAVGLIWVTLVPDILGLLKYTHAFGRLQTQIIIIGTILLLAVAPARLAPLWRWRRVGLAGWLLLALGGWLLYRSQWNIATCCAALVGAWILAPRHPILAYLRQTVPPKISRMGAKLQTLFPLVGRGLSKIVYTLLAPFRWLRWLVTHPKFYIPLVSFSLSILILGTVIEVVLRNPDSQESGLGVYGEYPEELVPSLNSHQFRDIEHTLEKPAGILRVVVLGDSFTWGQGVADDEVYVHLLGEMAGENVQFVSVAQRGWGTEDQLDALQTIGMTYDPDLIVVGVVKNDPEPHQSKPEGHHRDTRYLSNLPLDLSLFHFLDEKINRAGERLGFRPTYGQWEISLYDKEGELWQNWQLALADFFQFITQENLPTLVYTLPGPLAKISWPFESNKHEKLAIAYAEAGFDSVDLWPQFEVDFAEYDYQDLWALPNDAHPGSELHAWYAEQIWADLEPILAEMNLTD